jgi:Zn-dependent peptidase ImmA (M78 family)
LKERYWTVYVGGSEWRITETGKKSWIKKYLQRKDSAGLTIQGRCFKDHKAIFIRKGQHHQDRYETIFHELLHAVCAENLQNKTMAGLWDDEDATHIVSKGMCSLMRQARDFGISK